tara:strand:- start:3665 stop:4777 length:1113 start_codon:yes stop_codon:yes gene_type:complete
MKEFKLDKIKATGTTVGELHYPKVSLHLTCEGSNGSTTVTDSSNTNASITCIGSAQISTAQSKFGSSSLATASGDIFISTTNIFNFGTSDFTVEFWFYRTGLGSSNNFIVDGRPSGNNSNTFMLYMTTGTTAPRYHTNSSDQITSSINLGTNAWTHIAVVRNSGTTTLYMNGVSGGSFSDSTDYVDTGGTTLGFWAGSSTSYSQYTTPGFFDDFRVTKGLARYTTNFTPPTSAHLTSSGDINKHIVVNSTVDGLAIGTGGINQARVAKAWANIDMAAASILGSYNVSSITDNDTGDFTVTYSTAMSDSNYCWAGGAGAEDSTSDNVFAVRSLNPDNNKTTTTIRIGCMLATASAVDKRDYNDVNVMVFGN